uniref:Arrestin_C domain-containing protein n=1 Tax=Heterorhabditis bacteriophora TaxID=37862 RepID=A0A1I7XTZ0_HETBA
MGRKRAVRIIIPNHPLRVGVDELVEIHLRILDVVEVLNFNVVLEGRCRAAFSGQDALHTLTISPLPVHIQPLLIPTSKGVAVLPEGYHRLPLAVCIARHLPGTFTGRHGAIAYRILVKLSIRRFPTGEEASLEAERVVDVIGSSVIDTSSIQPISIERNLRKKVFCFNRLDVDVNVEIDRSTFIVGEYILVFGKVVNNHTANVVKNISVELRQKTTYSSGEAKKVDTRLISRLICGSVSSGGTFLLHHSLQIPADCYPSLSINGNPIQVSYELLLTSAANFSIDIPISIGNRAGFGSPQRRSIQYPESSVGKNSIYYCIPPSEYSYTSDFHDDPPPYSTHSHQGRPIFIPIHFLKTPYRQFTPVYNIPSVPPLWDPPKYRDEPRFLKIEELDD